MKLIWVGKYQSDLAYTNNIFNKSITYYGDGKNGNIACCSDSTRKYNKKNFLAFIIENIKSNFGEYEFIFYNSSYANEIINSFPECQKYIRNTNSSTLINWISNKSLVRVWAQNIIDIPSFSIISGSDCTFQNLCSLFPQKNKFIIQDNYSSGGVGTFLLDKESHYNNKIKKDDIYLVSPLIENSFSINIHLLIDSNIQILFKPSIQIIEPNTSEYIFRGSDFIEAQKINSQIITQMENCSKKIGRKLSAMGYKGICGIDYIVQKENLYFIEINPRFQGSSFLINRCLNEHNLPSMYELENMAFNNQLNIPLKLTLENLNVNYSFFKVKTKMLINKEQLEIYKKCSEIDTYFMDGVNLDKESQNGYIFRFVSKRNLVSINPNSEINIHQNLLIDNNEFISLNSNLNWTKLKTSLLLCGVKLDESVLQALKKFGGIQEGTFDSIDIFLLKKLVINCPIKLPFIEFSPYTLKFIKNKFVLYFYKKKISIVNIDYKDRILPIKTSSGILSNKTIQRNNNRIRIRHADVCVFKKEGKGCQFCHTKNEISYNMNLKDIEEAFQYYLKNLEFNQIMIGGASNNVEIEAEIIKSIIKVVRKSTLKSIYIMSIPPNNIDDILKYKQLGANEIAFNIEIFDEKTAKKIMPGKGKISREKYMKSLKTASDIFGKDGQVRSMLIVGLESLNTFKEGIEALCKIGVQPMISPFRPMKGSKLEFFVPPTMNDCLRYIYSAQEILDKYNMKLGPKDQISQNNTFNYIDIDEF